MPDPTPQPPTTAPPTVEVTPFSADAAARAIARPTGRQRSAGPVPHPDATPVAPPEAAAGANGAGTSAIPSDPQPAETPAVASVVAAEPTVADLLTTAQKAAARVVAKRKASASAVSQERQRAEQAELRAQQAEQARAQERELHELAQRNPQEYMRRTGLTDKVIAQQHIDDSTPEGKIAKLERELQAEKRAREERDQQAQSIAAQQDIQARERKFVGEIAQFKLGKEPGAPLEYAYLAARAKIAPSLVLAEARAAIHEHQQSVFRETGVPPHRQKPVDNKDVYDYLEWSYAQAESARLAEFAPKDKTTSPDAAAAQRRPAPKPNGASGTLSNKGTGPAVAPKPYGQMTPKERLAHDARQFAKVGIARPGKDYGD
jgi:hypothetical protein